jgi:hypothetical protein
MTEFEAARSELFLACARPRRGYDGETRSPVRVLGARVQRRPSGDLDHRVRRQAEHPALRTDLQGDRDPVRRRPRQRQKGERQACAGRAGAERADRRERREEGAIVLDRPRGVAGLAGHSRKPEQAWRDFASPLDGDAGAARARGRIRDLFRTVMRQRRPRCDRQRDAQSRPRAQDRSPRRRRCEMESS